MKLGISEALKDAMINVKGGGCMKLDNLCKILKEIKEQNWFCKERGLI